MVLNAVIRPVRGFSIEGTFSMRISKRAESASTRMVWMLRSTVGSAQICSLVRSGPTPASESAAATLTLAGKPLAPSRAEPSKIMAGDIAEGTSEVATLKGSGDTTIEVTKNADGSYTVRGEIKDYGAGQVFVDEQFYRNGPGSGFTGPEEEFVEDATWSRLREVTLSYNFGNNLTNWLRGASLSFTGRNLLLWTDYQGNDPDTNLTGAGQNGFGLDYFQNPGTRTYRIALNLNF